MISPGVRWIHENNLPEVRSQDLDDHSGIQFRDVCIVWEVNEGDRLAAVTAVSLTLFDTADCHHYFRHLAII